MGTVSARLLLGLMASLALAACGHNYPRVDLPGSWTDAAQVRVYSDINGTLYPANWRSPDIVGERALRSRHSIYAATALNPDKRARVEAEEIEQLAALTQLASTRHRAFVFLVGFNTDQASTAVELRAMQDVIGPSAQDIVIEFYWDGYNAAFGLDAARIWFWGAASSQVVGERGLRRVLNALGDREIVIVSYSRGASVVLSALSNPSYSERFERDTGRLGYLGPNYLHNDLPLREGGPIRVIMMAAAIGEPDFWASTGSHPRPFRPFPGRVESIRYGVNRNDTVLTKGGIGFSDNFNATDFGAYVDASERLRCHYPILEHYTVDGRFGHGVSNYIADASFIRMLHDSGVELRGEEAIEPRPVAPSVCP